MTSTRLDLRHVRLFLALVAIMLGVIAAAPIGASAEQNTGGTPSTGQSRCGDAGGTWTISADGKTGTCSGLGRNKDYKCHLDVGPNACEYLPFIAPTSTPGKGPRIVRVEHAGVYKAPAATPIPTYVAVASMSTVSEMSPLDE